MFTRAFGGGSAGLIDIAKWHYATLVSVGANRSPVFLSQATIRPNAWIIWVAQANQQNTDVWTNVNPSTGAVNNNEIYHATGTTEWQPATSVSVTISGPNAQNRYTTTTTGMTYGSAASYGAMVYTATE